MAVENLYVHFPFCRRKCSYCALHSRAGVTRFARDAYVRGLVDGLSAFGMGPSVLKTVYFGGGSPALCDLRPLLDALSPLLAPSCEFTVELHPLDVAPATLDTLRAGGVNRISMGVQSLDDAVLADMGRGYSADEAARAFACIRTRFDNAGIDLILGYPRKEGLGGLGGLEGLGGWGLRHCSVYSLILEERTILARRLAKAGSDGLRLPGDDEVLDEVKRAADLLRGFGLERYEISNYAVPGFECRHNLAVWRGEDYLGLGEGAFGRCGLRRTQNLGCPSATEETVTAETDAKERRLFRLRTREGLDASGRSDWVRSLRKFVSEGLLTQEAEIYRLTTRGTEVCDSILAELV